MTPAPEQRAILEHALGFQGGEPPRVPFRESYCADDGDPELEALVAAGWMRAGVLLNDGHQRYYHVTDAGRRVLGFVQVNRETLPEPLDGPDSQQCRVLGCKNVTTTGICADCASVIVEDAASRWLTVIDYEQMRS